MSTERKPNSVPISFANQGIVLKSTQDDLPLTAYAALHNVFTNLENCLQVRNGYIRAEATALVGVPHSIGYLQATGSYYRFVGAGGKFYSGTATGGLVDSGATGLSGRPGFMANYSLQGTSLIPYCFFADGYVFIKHNGAANEVRRIGIPAPAPAAGTWKAELQPSTEAVIDACGALTGWSVAGGGSPAVTLDAPNTCLNLEITGPNVAGYAYKNVTINLGTDDNETIELELEFPTAGDARQVDAVYLQFSLGDTTFATRYEKIIVPNQMEDATQSGIRTESPIEAIEERKSAVDRSVVEGSGKMSIADIDVPDITVVTDTQDTTTKAKEAPPGFGVFNIIRMAKKDFARIGVSALTDPSLNWEDVQAVRVEVRANSIPTDTTKTNIKFRNIVYRSTGQLTGSDLQWCFTYQYSVTGVESDYSPTLDVPSPGANKDQYKISFPAAPSTTAPAAMIDKIRLWRRGGTIENFQLVASLALGTYSGSYYVDNIHDLDLGQIVLDQDNQLPPTGVKGVEYHDERLWVWDGSNKLWFSRKNNVESFPTDFYIYAGTGSEEILRVISFDSELFVFTRTQVYRVIGSDQDTYRAVGTSFPRPLISATAVCAGMRSLYMVSYDGVYEFPSGKRISEAINPIFHNESVNGFSPIIGPYEDNSTVGSFDNKVYLSYTTTGTANNCTLVYDLVYERWHAFDIGISRMFPEQPQYGMQAMLLAGIVNAGSYLMRLETGFKDVNASDAGIAWSVTTKELDLGLPDQEKRFTDLVVDANAQGGTITVEAAFDGGSFATVGTITSSTRAQKVLPLPASTGVTQLARKMQVRFSGTTVVAASASAVIYKMIPRFYLDPARRTTFYTDWSDEGIAGTKIFRELHLEIDTFNAAITVAIEVDGAAAQTLTGVTANGQTKLYYALNTDIKGTLYRLKFTPTGSNEIKLFNYIMRSYAEADSVALIQTPWADEGAPNQRKRFRKLVVEVDNLALGATKTIAIDLQVDGVSRTITPAVITAAQTGRTEYSFSCNADTVGVLWRTVITAATANYMRFYRAWVDAIAEPFQEYRYETPWQDIGGIGRKRIRDLLIDCDTGGYDVTVTAWVDGAALPGTFTLNSNPTAPSYGLRLEIPFSMPVDTAGKIARITGTATTPFTIYRHTFVPFGDAWEDTIIETPWSDEGAPNQRKRFRKLVVEVENQALGATKTITVDLQIDGVSTTITPSTIGATATGRSEFVFSPNVDTVGVLWRCVLTAAANNSMRFYRAWVEAIPEPFQEVRYEGPWLSWGTTYPKRLRNIWVDCDTGGYNVTVTAWVDGAALPGTFTLNSNPTAPGYGLRKKISFSLPVDTVGRLARITATGALPFTIYEYEYLHFNEALEGTLLETPWSDEGAPRLRKRLRKCIVEMENLGAGTITLNFQVDGVTVATITDTASYRHEAVFSLPIDTVGTLWRVTGSVNTGQLRVYQAWVDAIQEPQRGLTYEGEWQFIGTISTKRFRNLLVEINTGGSPVTATPWIDGVALTATVITNSVRSVMVISLPLDTLGTIARVSLSGAALFTYYSHQFTYTEEPIQATIQETVWTGEGWPYDKLWKHITLDVDTGAVAGVATFWLDGVADQVIPIAATNGRASLTKSLLIDTIGKLARVTIAGTSRLYGVTYVVEKEPPDVTLADSYEQSFGVDEIKHLGRWMWLTCKAPANLTMEIFADEVLRATETVKSSLATGYARLQIDLPDRIKGRLFRFVFRSSSAFKIYWEKSEIDLRPLNSREPYAKYKFAPPQTY